MWIVNSWPWHGAMPYPWNTAAMPKHSQCNYIFIKETVNYPWRCFQVSAGKHLLSLTWKHAILKHSYRSVFSFPAFRVICCGRDASQDMAENIKLEACGSQPFMTASFCCDTETHSPPLPSNTRCLSSTKRQGQPLNKTALMCRHWLRPLCLLINDPVLLCTNVHSTLKKS